jgi:hypothetical protein
MGADLGGPPPANPHVCTSHRPRVSGYHLPDERVLGLFLARRDDEDPHRCAASDRVVGDPGAAGARGRRRRPRRLGSGSEASPPASATPAPPRPAPGSGAPHARAGSIRTRASARALGSPLTRSARIPESCRPDPAAAQVVGGAATVHDRPAAQADSFVSWRDPATAGETDRTASAGRRQHVTDAVQERSHGPTGSWALPPRL